MIEKKKYERLIDVIIWWQQSSILKTIRGFGNTNMAFGQTTR